jgi:hypothetical protein
MRCPVCKADNTGGPVCRRCKADLSLLLDLERLRDGCLGEARRHLHAANYPEARRLAARADDLRTDAESLQLLGLTSLLCRDFEQALQSALLARSL